MKKIINPPRIISVRYSLGDDGILWVSRRSVRKGVKHSKYIQ